METLTLIYKGRGNMSANFQQLLAAKGSEN